MAKWLAVVGGALLAACGGGPAPGVDGGSGVDGGRIDSGGVMEDGGIVRVDGGPVDPLARACQRRIDSPTGCSEECTAANQQAGGPSACGPQLDAITNDPEAGDWLACVGACSSARTCTTAAGSDNLLDCTCGAACVRARSAEFQAAYQAFADCVEPMISAACY